jgi:DNA-binding LacI/PurR family transcriptional regulator
LKDQHTIYDVAKLSGLSISTVSRVLNSPDHVNEATRGKVLAAIQQLGFVPKAEARARAMKSTHRIGVITPFFATPSFIERLYGIASFLTGKPYELVIYTVDSANRFESYLANLPINRNLDGLIIMSLPLGEQEAARLAEQQLETVLIEYPISTFSSVEIDDVEGGRMAAEYLLRKGHSRLAFLGDTNLAEQAIHPVSRRLVGFRQILAGAGIPLTNEYVRLAPYTQEQTRLAARELLNLHEPPTAIFAATDYQAFGVLKIARAMGIRIPDDLAVIGFDDLEMAEIMDLTTIRQHLDESGRIATELLLSRINDPVRTVQHIQIPLNIVERETV